MEAAGATESIPSGAEFDSALSMINGVIEALNLKIGFAAGNTEICGFAISADVDINELTEYFEGNYAPEEDVLTEAAQMNQTAKVSLEVLSTKDLKAPEYIHFDMNVAVDDIEVSVSSQLDAILNSKNELKGVTVNAAANLSGIQLSYESDYNEATDTYVATEIYGNVNINFNGTVDITNSDKTDAKLVDLKLSVNGTPTHYESYNEYTGEAVTKVVDMDSYSVIIDVIGNVTVKSKGSASVYVDVNANVEGTREEVVINGTLNWLSAPNFTGLPADIKSAVSTDFADVYEQALENAENVRRSAYDPNVYNDDWTSYLWYDQSTGLYIILTNEYEGSTRVFVNMPPEYCYDSQIH